jgi:hypothetical protein
MHLEDIWRDRWNRGYTALRFREFVAELVAAGFQSWQEKNPLAGVELEEPEPLGNEWDFDEAEKPPREIRVFETHETRERLAALERRDRGRG